MFETRGIPTKAPKPVIYLTPYELIGKKFTYLTIVAVRGIEWKCLCRCGETVTTLRSRVFSGHVKSCGCLKAERTSQRTFKHGLVKSKEYRAWQNAKDRCTNKNNGHYKSYGGRGIKMCAHWRDSFENFYADMGPCPSSLTLERINNEKGYVIGNCKWATLEEQARNTRQNKLTSARVKAIRQLYRHRQNPEYIKNVNGCSTLVKMFNVSSRTIRNIALERNWKNV